MASKKISGLPAATLPITTGVKFEAIQAGVNVQVDASDLPIGSGAVAAVDVSFSPAGTLSSTDVQSALQELDADILAAVAGLKWKNAVRVATVGDATIATAYENGDTVDGVVLATGDRILLKNQTDQTVNGIYTVNASGDPSRSTDADSAVELEGAAVSVLEGTTNANTTWLQTTDNVTLGVSNIVWGQFGSSVPDADETTKGIAERATNAEVITGSDTTRFVSPASLHAKVVGVQDFPVMAFAMWPRTTGGCQLLTQVEMATSIFNVQVLDFDQTTQEFAQGFVVLPRKYNNSTITATVYWTASAGSGGVVWGISMGSYRNDDALTTALGTAVTVSDTLIATSDLHITSASSAITPAGTIQDQNLFAFQISRNPADGSDTLTGDARLLGIVFHVTTDAAKDA